MPKEVISKASPQAPLQVSEQPLYPYLLEVAKMSSGIVQRATKLTLMSLRRRLKSGISLPTDDIGLSQAYIKMLAKMMLQPGKLTTAQMNLAWDLISLWQRLMSHLLGIKAAPLAQPSKSDKRFKDELWNDHVLFDFVKQYYLITARYLLDAVSNVKGLDELSSKKVNFFTRQYIDALSPTNFALTNPEVIRETFNSNGLNLLKGFNNLLRDIEAGDGRLRIKMTDETAFVLGENVATTAGKVVFQNELIQLLQFEPTTEKQYKKPLLIMSPWINKYYILDLRQSNSFIKWATDQGHTVFCVSWINPDEHLANKSFDFYMTDGALAALDAIEAHTGEKEVNVIGYCLGGTLLGATLAYLKEKKQKRIASATFLVCLLDFSIPGELGTYIDEKQITALEKKMKKRGYLDGSEMAGTFNSLRANDLIWSLVINNYLLGKEPLPFDLLYWNSDSTRMPYKMHSFYLRNMYLKNLLRVPGGITLDGVPIDIAKNTTPSYFISTIEDHIAPWKGTYLGASALGGPTRFVLGGSGHIAGVVNPPAANKYGYWTGDPDASAMPETPDEWLATAVKHDGSWWNDWQAWIDDLNGGRMVTARKPDAGKLTVLEDAPGTFVKCRSDQKVKALAKK